MAKLLELEVDAAG